MKLATRTDEADSPAFESGAHDAIELLTADHKDLEMLLADYEELIADSAIPMERSALARQICLVLTAHSTVEEELFYPAAREALLQPELLDQAEAEHASAKTLVARIRRTDAADVQYDAMMMQLHAAIDHHVQEEASEIFPRMRDSEVDLHRLGEQIARRKAEVMAELTTPA
jgi:hemerythrin superfamily protein